MDETPENPLPAGDDEDVSAADADRVADDEVLAMWFTPYPGYFEPPDRPTRANFQLRRGEASLSVWRLGLTTEAKLRADHALPAETVFLTATAAEVRGLCNAEGTPLNLDAVSDDPAGDKPGHAGVTAAGRAGRRFTGGMTKALQRLFCEPWPRP